MRLGQAARKYKTSTSELVKQLAVHFRTVNDHPNIKLTEEEVAFFEQALLQKEATQQVEATTSEIRSTDAVSSAEQEISEKQQEESPQKAPAYVEKLRPQVFTLENEFNERTQGLEKFKAEKPELDGLKVLGKIELPEPKEKKEQKDKKPKRQESRRNVQDRNRQPRKNQAAEERKKAERIAKRKKIEAEKCAKALKKKYYEENVKAKLQSPKPKKKKKKSMKPEASIPAAKKVMQQKAKKATGLKRFWLWLNGAYDRID